MNNKNRLIKVAIPALLTLGMAGTSAQVLSAALGVGAPMLSAWLPALAAAVVCALVSCSGVLTAMGAVAGIALAGLGVSLHLGDLSKLPLLVANLFQPTEEMAQLTGAGALLTGMAAVFFAMLYYLMLYRPGGTPFALLLLFTTLVGSYALAQEISLWMAVPGLIAALAAFALAGEVQRDANAWRVIGPTIIAVAVAMLLVPSQKVTWKPLEDAANRIRMAVEDYFHFTTERTPFTISIEGYNHAAEIDGVVQTLLGGPADPDTDPVMLVTTDRDVLLRGAVRRTYNGHAWTDSDAKARYLFYDFTRSHVREKVFGMTNNEAFTPVDVSVQMLDGETSTLFVPARMDSFDMTLETAVYYNTIGEMFLARTVEEGDAYTLVSMEIDDEAALREAVIRGKNKGSEVFAEAMETCMALPQGVEGDLYALALEIVENCDNDYDKAVAIESWLRNHCTYTLETGYPNLSRDFVSEFVLETREGYCSYFASAMAVMCRIVGLPSRYVEGYRVEANGGEAVTVTGENAHAWTEVCFDGVGWVAFDPANGGSGGDEGRSDQSEQETLDHPETSPTPTPTPEPTTPPMDEPQDSPTPSPTPDPLNAQQNTPEPTPSATPQPEDEPTIDPNSGHRLTWLWILLGCLLLLLILALIVWLARRRLAATDPILLSAKAETEQQSVMILYRSILTLLARGGQAPMSGETPSAFARRICEEGFNPDFVAFADAVALSVYARGGASDEAVQLGRNAYQTFMQSLKKREKLRFAVHRILHGLGNFEAIP